MNKYTTSITPSVTATIISVIIGLAYYFYLETVSFPPAFARIIPFIWLVLAAIGLFSSIKPLRTASKKSPATFVCIVAGLLSLFFASAFALGALIGD
jgi:hypothetical protein